jgi:DNA-binding LacI/PurR family transcriptional regulator
MPQLPAETAEKVLTKYMRSKDTRLPTIRDLARQFGVSKGTMEKAVQLLKQRGFLQAYPGRGTWVTAESKSGRKKSNRNADESAVRLYTFIRNKILDGTFRVGKAIPKVHYFVVTEHVSPDTVCSALKMLSEEKLIWKRGKTWIAGPPVKQERLLSITSVVSKKAPVILLLVPDYGVWHKVTNDPHPLKFTESFYHEIEKYGIKTELIQGKPGGPDLLPRNAGKVRSTIQSLGTRYMGTLFMFEKFDIPSLKKWILWIGQFKKSIVWFDYEDYGKKLELDTIPGGKFYYRCHKDEATAVAMAMDPLVNLGHRTIGIPHFHSTAHAWIPHRIELFKAQAKQYKDPVSIVEVDQPEEVWFPRNWESPEEFNAHLANFIRKNRERMPVRHQGNTKTAQRRQLLACLPSLEALVTNPEVTAIAAPNDFFAHQYYLCLREMGISVPEDISMISFDNNKYARLYPISSIDFGFSELSYSIAHLFIGDLPIKADRRHNIPSRPKLLDRGSLGPPRKGGLIL